MWWLWLLRELLSLQWLCKQAFDIVLSLFCVITLHIWSKAKWATAKAYIWVFTKVAMSNTGLQARQEVISLLLLLKQEAGVASVSQVEMHSKCIWINDCRRRVLLYSWKHKYNKITDVGLTVFTINLCPTKKLLFMLHS